VRVENVVPPGRALEALLVHPSLHCIPVVVDLSVREGHTRDRINWNWAVYCTVEYYMCVFVSPCSAFLLVSPALVTTKAFRNIRTNAALVWFTAVSGVKETLPKP
jgi:hypothetical protein